MTISRYIVLLASAFMLLAGHSQVHAHSALVASTPGSEQTVTAPERLALEFNEGVRMLRLNISDADSEEVTIDFSPNATARSEFEWALPTLSPGAYAVEWTLIGSDGHSVTGGITFTVDPAGDTQNGLLQDADDHHNHH